MIIEKVTIFKEFCGGRDYPQNTRVFLEGDGRTLELNIPEDFEDKKKPAFAIFKCGREPFPKYSLAEDALTTYYEHELYGAEEASLQGALKEAVISYGKDGNGQYDLFLVLNGRLEARFYTFNRNARLFVDIKDMDDLLANTVCVKVLSTNVGSVYPMC